MKFGLFEHMDDAGVPLGQQSEKSADNCVEACDRYGFYAYHLGRAPRDAAGPCAVSRCVPRRCRAADETTSVRSARLFAAAVPSHPVDRRNLHARSDERRTLGVRRRSRRVAVRGRASYGVNPADGARQVPEALRVIKQGLTSDELTFSGEFYKFKRVPMVLKPVQRPYPPIWYGVLTPDAAYWAAVEKAHIVTLVPPELGARHHRPVQA